jgi:putative ABC transport system ATP-binding protein
MAESFIEITGLRKSYQMGQAVVHALDGVDLHITRRSFTLVMGPSGSGKSTLLYLLGGLDRPSAGQIQVEGQNVNALDENQLAAYRRQMIGFIFQSFNLIPSMTALENVVFPTRFARVPRRRRVEQARKLLERVGLGDRMHHRPTELSGGQQQRVAVARALVNNPQIILADEPTGNLDTSSGLSILQLLADLHRDGATVVVVTHDVRNLRFSTGVQYLLDGKIVDESQYQSATNLSSDLVS